MLDNYKKIRTYSHEKKILKKRNLPVIIKRISTKTKNGRQIH